MLCFSQAGPQTQPVLSLADTFNQIVELYLMIKIYFHSENQDELII